MRKTILTVLTLLSCVSAGAIAQSPDQKYSTTVCAEDMASGFNWESGEWKTARFKSSRKILIRKLARNEVVQTGNFLSTPWLCLRADLDTINKILPEQGMRNGCYLVKDFEQKNSSISDADVCNERLNSLGEIEKVECERVHFHPQGNFIRLPWLAAMDISSNPKNGYKDSLNIGVGKCSSLD